MHVGLPPSSAGDTNVAPAAFVGRKVMLFALEVVLFVAWLFGIAGGDAHDPFVHVLLIVAIVLCVEGIFDRRRTIF